MDKWSLHDVKLLYEFVFKFDESEENLQEFCDELNKREDLCDILKEKGEKND